MVVTMSAVVGFLRSGKLKALLLGSGQRSVLFTDVPTGTEAGFPTYECQQFHGGYGLMRGSAIERLFRDARVHAIGGGATEVMLEEVAKRMPWGL